MPRRDKRRRLGQRRAASRKRTKRAAARMTRSAAARRAFEALSQMRHGKSLTRAAKSAHTSPRTIKKYVGTSLAKPQRVFVAQRVDRAVRHMKFPSPDGTIGIEVAGSRSASRVGSYWSAIDHYLRSGDASRLRPFTGKSIRSGGTLHRFITDLPLIERLANAGFISFEELYGDTISE